MSFSMPQPATNEALWWELEKLSLQVFLAVRTYQNAVPVLVDSSMFERVAEALESRLRTAKDHVTTLVFSLMVARIFILRSEGERLLI